MNESIREPYPIRHPNPSDEPMVCPHCQEEISNFASKYGMAQAEVIVVVMCPHCRKILGIVGHSCDD